MESDKEGFEPPCTVHEWDSWEVKKVTDWPALRSVEPASSIAGPSGITWNQGRPSLVPKGFKEPTTERGKKSRETLLKYYEGEIRQLRMIEDDSSDEE